MLSLRSVAKELDLSIVKKSKYDKPKLNPLQLTGERGQLMYDTVDILYLKIKSLKCS